MPPPQNAGTHRYRGMGEVGAGKGEKAEKEREHGGGKINRLSM